MINANNLHLNFMTIVPILIASFGVMLVSLIGVVFAGKTLHDWADRNLKYLTSFATGTFLIVAYNLYKETFEIIPSLQILLLALAAGLAIAYLLDRLIPDAHHHHTSGKEPEGHSRAGAHRIMLSDALHNITDGFLIAPAFAIDIRLGIATTVGIAVHEVAQEISEFFVFKSAGLSTKQALTRNFISSGTILIGSVGGFLLLSANEGFVGIILAIAAGIITYSIFRDLIPHSLKHAKRDNSYLKHIIAILIGILLVFGINTVSGDTHNHEDSDGHNHGADEHHDKHDHDEEEKLFGNHSEDDHDHDHDTEAGPHGEELNTQEDQAKDETKDPNMFLPHSENDHSHDEDGHDH